MVGVGDGVGVGLGECGCYAGATAETAIDNIATEAQKLKNLTRICNHSAIPNIVKLGKSTNIDRDIMNKQQDTLAILKLYELRRDKQMREARQWYFSSFTPGSAADIVKLYRDGERASANFRMVASYWDTAASLVLNGGIDKKMFLEANTEHIFVYAKIADHLPGVRELFGEPDFLINLEMLCREMPDFEIKMAGRKRLAELWTKAVSG